jgi:hypothetical protein
LVPDVGGLPVIQCFTAVLKLLSSRSWNPFVIK